MKYGVYPSVASSTSVIAVSKVDPVGSFPSVSTVNAITTGSPNLRAALTMDQTPPIAEERLGNAHHVETPLAFCRVDLLKPDKHQNLLVETHQIQNKKALYARGGLKMARLSRERHLTRSIVATLFILVSNPFQRDGDALPDANAHRSQGKPTRAQFQFKRGGAGYPGPRHAKRVA